MSAEYRVMVFHDREKGSFTARAPELERCEATAATRTEAVAKLEEEIDAQMHNMRAAGHPPPAPVEDQAAFSGELKLRVPSGLHRDLVWLARAEGVPLEQIATDLLARGVEARGYGRAAAGAGAGAGERDGARGGSQNRAGRDGQGARYHGIMDDRANFIEYVRGLESGGGRGGRRGSGGGERGR
ncbi:MAG: toxin-antitoxin system HicB family antitoxin [Myxococcota bacterium]